MSADSLYDKYGGFSGISGVVQDFYRRVLTSPNLKRFFVNSNVDRLIDHQIKFLCKVLGGPDNYDGRALDKAHKMLGITPQAFGEVGDHLAAALEAAGVELADIDTIMGVVASVRQQIVTAEDIEQDSMVSTPAQADSTAAATHNHSVTDQSALLEALDGAFALVHPGKLSLSYANSRFMDWASIQTLPCPLADALPPDALASMQEPLKDRRESWTFECEMTAKDGRKIPVAYTLRWLNWRGGRYALYGSDMSNLKEKDHMLKSFTQVIEVNNKKLKLEQRAVAELLDNMKQAVFTFNADFKISSRYSKFVHKLFGDAVSVSGRHAIEFIFEDSDLAVSDRDKFALELNLCFANGEFQWDLAVLAFPKQIKKKIAGVEKDIRLVFEPIFYADQLSRVMCIMEDVTAFNKARSEADAKAKDLERIGQLMAVNGEHFAVFESEIWGIFKRCEEALQSLKESLSQDAGERVKKDIGDLFRHIHTIKGNARSIQLKAVQEVAHRAEDYVSLWREQSVSPEELLKLEDELAFIKAEVRAYCELRKTVFGGESRSNPISETMQQLDLLNQISRAHKSGAEALQTAMQALEVERRRLTDKLCRSSMLRFDSIAQDVALELGKKVRPIEFKGDILAFMRMGQGLLNEILTHALRNAVDHGIESSEFRLAHGKPEAGTITIGFGLSAGQLVLSISDDGRGLDPKTIREKAIEKGLLSAEAAQKLSEAESYELLFVSGFSTATRISTISGRGVGMAAIRHAAEELGGRVIVGNGKQGGTELIIQLPDAARGSLKAAS